MELSRSSDNSGDLDPKDLEVSSSFVNRDEYKEKRDGAREE
jgi:hypothetical protein